MKIFSQTPSSGGGAGTVTSVTGTSPITSSGGATPDIALGTVPESKGGTNQTTYAKGDILYASAANTLGKLAIGTQTGQIPVVQSTGILGYENFFNPSKRVVFYDDFIMQSPGTATVASAWASYSTGAGSFVFNAVFSGAGTNWSNAYPGVMSIRTGTATTGGSTLYSSERSAVMPGGGATFFETNIAVTAVSDGTNTYKACFGFQAFSSGSPNALPTDGFYWTYTHGENGGKILFNVSKASTATTVDTGITPVANTFVKLGFLSNSAGTSYQLYVNGVSTGSAVITNIPLSTTGLAFVYTILKSASTTSRDLAVDYTAFLMELATAR